MTHDLRHPVLARLFESRNFNSAVRPSRAPLSGRTLGTRNPGLKPWATMYSRFAANRTHTLGHTLLPPRGKLHAGCVRFEHARNLIARLTENLQDFLVGPLRFGRIFKPPMVSGD
jgi:hypothetical protein